MANYSNSTTLLHEQTLGYWLATKGITRKALDTHPHCDDIILLLKWRDSMWHKLNPSEQAIWGAYWGSVYHKRRKLKNKALKKLEQITITATERHNRQEQQSQQARSRIQSLRKAKHRTLIKKSSANMTAKSEDAACSAPWE